MITSCETIFVSFVSSLNILFGFLDTDGKQAFTYASYIGIVASLS